MFDAIKKELVERAAEKLAQKGLDMGFKALLSSLGLGQDDIKDVFKKALDKINERPIITAEQSEGVTIAMKEIFSVLQDEDIMTSDTKKSLTVELEAWTLKRKKV